MGGLKVRAGALRLHSGARIPGIKERSGDGTQYGGREGTDAGSFCCSRFAFSQPSFPASTCDNLGSMATTLLLSLLTGSKSH